MTVGLKWCPLFSFCFARIYGTVFVSLKAVYPCHIRQECSSPQNWFCLSNMLFVGLPLLKMFSVSLFFFPQELNEMFLNMMFLIDEQVLISLYWLWNISAGIIYVWLSNFFLCYMYIFQKPGMCAYHKTNLPLECIENSECFLHQKKQWHCLIQLAKGIIYHIFGHW